MTKALLAGLVNIAIFMLPIPLVAWLDRAKRNGRK